MLDFIPQSYLWFYREAFEEISLKIIIIKLAITLCEIQTKPHHYKQIFHCSSFEHLLWLTKPSPTIVQAHFMNSQYSSCSLRIKFGPCVFYHVMDS